MRAPDLETSAARPRVGDEFDPTAALALVFHWSMVVLALASYGLVLGLLFHPRHLPGVPGLPESLLLLLTTLSTLSALSRQLPAQNVFLAASVIGGIGTVAHLFDAATSIPFGPIQFADKAGPKLFSSISWIVPALWVLVVLNSRGVARLILRPWRKLRAYGFWLIGFTVLLTVLFVAALEPFGGAVNRYWFWTPTRLPLGWGGAPLTNFLGWFVVTLLAMAFAAPALIDKRARPVKRPPDYHPLAVWGLGVLLFGCGAALHQFWWATGYCGCVLIIVTTFAWRGARW